MRACLSDALRRRPQVIATSRTDYSKEAGEIKATFFSDADDFVEEVSARFRASLAPPADTRKCA